VRSGVPTRKPTVCLLSAHPLVVAEWERQLSSCGFDLELRQLESTLTPDINKLALPCADVFVSDAHAPRQATESLVGAIQERWPSARQIVVAEAFSEINAFPLLRLGAKGLLNYTEAGEKLPQAVRAVANGGFWVPRDLLARFIDTNLVVGHGRVPPGLANVTQREREVLDALLENLANKEIADRLHISERTVKFHVSSLLEKFGVRRRSDLILLCFQDRSPVPGPVL